MNRFRKCVMLSLKEIASVSVAINLCNSYALKREILCAPGSDYVRGYLSPENRKKRQLYGLKAFWSEMIRRNVGEILKNLRLTKNLHGEILAAIFSVGMKMLIWAEYHEYVVDISREYTVKVFNSSFLAQPGIVDNKKIAEELMKDNSLSAKQKYNLACLYCLTDDIPDLYTQIRRRDEETSRKYDEHPLVNFWNDYQMGLLGHLEEISLNELMFEKAVISGNKASVEYCLERVYFGREIVALETAVNILGRSIPYVRGDILYELRYFDLEDITTPIDYEADVLYFLLSKITENDKKKFFSGDPSRCRVLRYFLNWPYQNCFISMVKLIFESLTEDYYVAFFLNILDSIHDRDEMLLYGERTSCYYKVILKEFWQLTPDSFKRYVLTTEELYDVVPLLLKLNNFSLEDEENIQMILKSASDDEKMNIVSCDDWRQTCMELIVKERWEILDVIVSDCFPSKLQATDFLKGFLYTKDGPLLCVTFTEAGEWRSAESFFKRIASTEEEINKLKKELIYSVSGKKNCFHVLQAGVKTVDRFIRWHFHCEEEVTTFKKELIFTEEVLDIYENLIVAKKLELFDEFTSLCLSSEDEVRVFKKYVSRQKGRRICERLLVSYSLDSYIRECYGTNDAFCCHDFKEGKWEEVEKFLTWCFSSEEEIREFKRENFQDTAVDIYLHFIISNNSEDAEIFLVWLGLSTEEIKELKKETLFHRATRVNIIKLMHCCRKSVKNKQETFELLLRRCLPDKERVLEFQNDFRRWYEMEEITEEEKIMFNTFERAIIQRLNDLDENESEYKIKRWEFFHK